MPLGPATGALQVPATGTVQVPDAPASGGHGCHLNNLLANAVGGAPSSPTLPTQVKRTFRSLSSVKDTGGTERPGRRLACSQTGDSGVEPGTLRRDRGGADRDLWGEWPSLQREHDKLTAFHLYQKQRHVGSRRTFPGWPTRINAGELFWEGLWWGPLSSVRLFVRSFVC